MSDYRPINCNFYDELEARATLRQPCVIAYRPQLDAPITTVTGIIDTLYIRDKVEYLRLTDGVELRLDWLVAVDDRELGAYC
jgi:Rho-binding antiterminator